MARTVRIAGLVVSALVAGAAADPVLVPQIDGEPAKPATKPAPKVAPKAVTKTVKRAPKKQLRKKPVAKKRTTAKATKSRGRGKAIATSHSSRPAPAKTQVAPALDITTTAAHRYGTMSSEACLAELGARKISYKREPATLGVVTPVRLTAPLNGIDIRTNQKAAQRLTSRWEIADCRLVLAVDDFTKLLAKHDIVELRHYSMYRTPPTSFSAGDTATRHPGALAIDAARFVKRDGTYLDVLDHYHGRIGQTSCGEDADPPSPATPEAVELRQILCETVAAKLFNVVLTPNHDRPHRNHFHLEVTPGVKWFLVK